MITRGNGRTHNCVLVDLNTQRDFCEQHGARPVANHERLVPVLRRLVAWARWHFVPVISSLESHRPWEVSVEGIPTLYCVDGTVGQRKIPFTLFPCRTRIEADNTFTVPPDLFGTCQQVIFPKRTPDLFANPKADRFLTQLPVHEFVVFGNIIELDIKALVLGLLARGKRVMIPLDACGYWDESSADLSVRQILAKGAEITSVEEVISRHMDRRHRILTYSRRNQTVNGNGTTYPRSAHIKGWTDSWAGPSI